MIAPSLPRTTAPHDATELNREYHDAPAQTNVMLHAKEEPESPLRSLNERLTTFKKEEFKTFYARFDIMLQEQESKLQELEAHSQELEAHSQELEAQSQELEAQSQELEAQSRELEAMLQTTRRWHILDELLHALDELAWSLATDRTKIILRASPIKIKTAASMRSAYQNPACGTLKHAAALDYYEGPIKITLSNKSKRQREDYDKCQCLWFITASQRLM